MKIIKVGKYFFARHWWVWYVIEGSPVHKMPVELIRLKIEKGDI